MPTTRTPVAPEAPAVPADPAAGPVVFHHALLADGTTVLIRPVTPHDLPAVRALYAGLSPQSIRMRFFASGTHAGQDAAARLCRPDPDRIALLALACRPGGERVVGEAEAWRLAERRTAEVGFTVAEDLRGRGVGTLLLEHLADAARAAGITRFVAETQHDNTAMKRVIASAGLRHSAEFEQDGVVFHDIDLDGGDVFLEAVADREFRASAASLAPLFRPAAVAVVGAGREPGGVGRAILDHVAAAGYGGRLFAVNPRAETIAGVPCVRSVRNLPAGVDLAVIAVPPAAVVRTAVECGRAGIRALTVVTSSMPADTTRVLKTVCRRFGMRLVGPNCLGVAAFSPPAAADPAGPAGPADQAAAARGGVALDATFAAHTPAPGRIGVAVQSGGVGIAVLEQLAALGLGVSSFASLGDKADVSGNDLLAWWAQDPDTELVLLHLESFGNPRKFARFARRVARTKPVLIVEAGRSEAGSRAAASHTAAAVTPTVTRRALYRQAGVIATKSTAELVETAALLVSQPLPAGRRVAVVSNAGGIGVLAADACIEAGLTVAEFGPELRARLAALLGPAAAVGNPVDAGAGAGAEALRSAIAAIADSGEADSVLVLPVPTALADLDAVLGAGPACGPLPMVAVRVDQADAVSLSVVPGPVAAGPDPADPAARGGRVPVYGDAENAARALAHAAHYADWLREPHVADPVPAGIRAADATGIITRYLADRPEGGWLPPDLAAGLLGCYGVPVARLVLARDEQQAVTAAAEWGGPVAMKAYWPELVHKSDIDGVLLGLAGPADVRAGWALLHRRFGDRLTGVVVQEMAPRGVELLAGVDSDPVFGPLVGFGVGGTETDLVGEHRFGLTPLTATDTDRLLAEPRAARLLAGYRGRPGGDPAAVRDVLLRLARLAADQPLVAEAEVNPLIATPDRAVAADFRIRVEPRQSSDPYLRRLR